MRNLPDRRVLIRWMFNALGFLLIFGHNFVVHNLLCADFWGRLIFGENSAGFYYLVAAAYLYLLPTSLLCWITAAGLKRNKRWSRPVGIFTCALLFCGFPFLMIAGAIGIHVLTAKSSRPGPAAADTALYRIKLAAILRQSGLPEEARAALPAGPPLLPAVRRAFLAERAELHLVRGRTDLAMADCHELVALWRAHPCAPAPEIACAEALLAKACLAAGELAEAEALARQAADLLGAWQHPDAASCLITLALAQSQSTGECSSASLDEAFRLIEAAGLLSSAEKTRLREAETARIEQASAGVPVLA